MTHEEKALVSVIKAIQETVKMINLAVDDDDIRRYKGEWTRCQTYLSLIRRDMAVDNEVWQEACKELRVLEGYEDA